MEDIGRFAETFGYTPDEFRALSWPDYLLLHGYLEQRERRAG